METKERKDAKKEEKKKEQRTDIIIKRPVKRTCDSMEGNIYYIYTEKEQKQTNPEPNQKGQK